MKVPKSCSGCPDGQTANIDIAPSPPCIYKNTGFQQGAAVCNSLKIRMNVKCYPHMVNLVLVKFPVTTERLLHDS